MPIAIDGTSPAGVVSPSTLTTVSFTPPADSLLVACAMTTAGVISNTGTARTWTNRKQHATHTGLRIYTAPNPTASALTVSVTGSGALKMYVVTGHNIASPAGASGTGSTSTNNATVNGYTSTGANSRGIVAAINWAAGGNPSSTDANSYAAYYGDFGMGMLAATKAANTPTIGTNVQFNLDGDGTGTADWAWVALEILAGALDASADLTVVEIPLAVPSPSISAGASTTPDTVTATTAVPAPTVSFGAGASLATVTAAAAVPAPSVTTDNAELVTLDTVTAAAAVPAPAVSAGAGVTLAAVAGAADVPAPVITNDASIVLPVVAVTVDVPTLAVTVPVLPGDQLDGSPGQMEWNGFVLGRSTPYRWRQIEGWRGKEPPDSGNAPHANRHGSAPGRPLAREKAVTWTAFIKSPREEVEAAVLALENATPFLRDSTQWPLVVNDLGTPYLAYGRIDRVHIPLDKLARLGYIPIALQWIMADTRRYNINATGVTCPKGEVTDISNAGNTETNPLIVIPGPAVTPRMTNHTLGRVLEFGVTLLAGEELVIDTDLGRARVGTTDVMGVRSFSSVSVWDWVLDRGTQEVEYTTASGGTQAEVLYRDAWI